MEANKRLGQIQNRVLKSCRMGGEEKEKKTKRSEIVLNELVTLRSKLRFPLNLLISMLPWQSNIAVFKAGTGGRGGYWEAFLSR